jgi:hypothetical protein
VLNKKERKMVINLITEAKDFYTENYKTLLKVIKEHINKEENIPLVDRKI